MKKRRPTHPGEVFKPDILEPLSISVSEAAKMLGISRKALSEFINQKTSLSPTMAIRIARATNTTPESWLNMQTKLNIWIAENKDIRVIPFHSESRVQA